MTHRPSIMQQFVTLFSKKTITLSFVVAGAFLMTLPTETLAAPTKKETSTQKKSAKSNQKAKPEKKNIQAQKSTKKDQKLKTAQKSEPATKKTKSSKKTAKAQEPQKKLAQSRRKAAPKSENRRTLQDTEVLALASNSALVLGQDDGKALFQKNAHHVLPIASITKLMTAMVVLDAHPNLSAPITISDDDVDYQRGSRSRLAVGSQMTRETALLLALMSSENRASHALARHYPGGMKAFLAAMNTKAQAIGMKHTRFEDPTGLTERNVATAYDLAKLVTAAHRYPLIREFSTTIEAQVDISGQELTYRNTNPLVNSASWDVGLSKTGFIHEAGKCLVMQAKVADRPVVIVLLDSSGKLTRTADANRIRRWMEKEGMKETKA